MAKGKLKSKKRIEKELATGPSEATKARQAQINIELQKAKKRREAPDKMVEIGGSRFEQARKLGLQQEPQTTIDPSDVTKDEPDQPQQAGIAQRDRAIFAFAHPFQSATLKGETLDQATRNFYGQSIGNQVLDIGAATLGYGATILSLGIGAKIIGGAIAAKSATAGGTAVITRTATEISKRGLTITTQRAFVGKAATTGINKIFSAVRPVATRFATNVKSGALTTGFLAKLGLSMGAVILLKDAIGTYPFAGFIKEEASQTTGIGFFQAQKNGDVIGMQEAIERQEEIINAEGNILDSIPYLNVQNQLKEYFKSVAVKLESDKRILASFQQ